MLRHGNAAPQTRQPRFDNILISMAMQRQASERVLQKLQEHPDAWTRVDSVLEHSQSQQAKFYALQVHTQPALRYMSAKPSLSKEAAAVGSLRRVSGMTTILAEGSLPSIPDRCFMSKLQNGIFNVSEDGDMYVCRYWKMSSSTGGVP